MMLKSIFVQKGQLNTPITAREKLCPVATFIAYIKHKKLERESKNFKESVYL